MFPNIPRSVNSAESLMKSYHNRKDSTILMNEIREVDVDVECEYIVL